MKSKLFIFNDGSGKAELVAQYRERLSDSRMKELRLDRSIDLAVEIARAVDEGCETIFAAGGDGTINAVVNAIMRLDEDRRPVLAIIPTGSANDFATGTLHIPPDVDGVLDMIHDGEVTPMDVVEIRAAGFVRYFANVAAGGNSVRVSEQLSDDVKKKWGALSYIRGSIGVINDLNSYHVIADLDGERIEIDSWGLLVANGNTNAGGIMVAPKASPDDGLMDVILIRDGSALDMVEIISKTLICSFLECEQVVFRQVKRLELRSEPAMRFTMDGEIFDEKPDQFTIIPDAVRMLIGRDWKPGAAIAK